MTDKILILTTCKTQENAINIANELVKNSLAACVQINPNIQSIYTWKDGLCHDQEVQVFIKTKKHLFAKIRDLIQEMHTYDVPQIISIPIEDGSKEYLSWMDEVMKV